MTRKPQPKCLRCGRFVTTAAARCGSCRQLRPFLDRMVNFCRDLHAAGVPFEVDTYLSQRFEPGGGRVESREVTSP